MRSGGANGLLSPPSDRIPIMLRPRQNLPNACLPRKLSAPYDGIPRRGREAREEGVVPVLTEAGNR